MHDHSTTSSRHAAAGLVRGLILPTALLTLVDMATAQSPATAPPIGQEVAIRNHLANGTEYTVPLRALLRHGKRLFAANWTVQEGAGRPLQKGNGAPLTDTNQPLMFPRAFNRISANDANSCAGCHNAPHGFVGGGGDFVTGVFVLGQRFDFATLDPADTTPLRGTTAENGAPASLQTIGNYRASIGMAGAGYIELLAREITIDLQLLRDALPPGGSTALHSKGIDYGVLARDQAGTWLVHGVRGLPGPSTASGGPAAPPSLVVRPFHQAGAVISLRQFSNNAFHHHHGMQSTERFGVGTDPDGDQFTDELTRADITAVTVFQATLPVPGRVIPRSPALEGAIARGEQLFTEIGCGVCHIPTLPLLDARFVEPNPFNPPGNLRPGDAQPFVVDLADARLPKPRLPQQPQNGITEVPAFTDLRLHDLCDGPSDPAMEALDMLAPAGSPAFFAGNRQFLTKKLWGCANEPPYFHHGQFTTLREAVLGHGGEGGASRRAFLALPKHDQDCLIECLKSLQVLPSGTPSLVVDEDGNPRRWIPNF